MTIRKQLTIMFYDEARGWVMDTLEVDLEVEATDPVHASDARDPE